MKNIIVSIPCELPGLKISHLCFFYVVRRFFNYLHIKVHLKRLVLRLEREEVTERLANRF